MVFGPSTLWWKDDRSKQQQREPLTLNKQSNSYDNSALLGETLLFCYVVYFMFFLYHGPAVLTIHNVSPVVHVCIDFSRIYCFVLTVTAT